MAFGPRDLFSAIVAHLPATLYDEAATPYSIKWSPRRSLPQGTQPLAYPRGVFEIVSSNTYRRGAGRAGVEVSTPSDSDTIPFVSGTLTYEVEQQDIDSITSVVATVSGVPNTTIAPSNYTFDRTSITFTGTTPDAATNFVVTYTHKMYARRLESKSQIVVRCMLYVKDAGHAGGKEALAYVLGESLEQQLQAKAGLDLYVPPVGDDLPMTGQAKAGRVLMSKPGVSDESESVACHVVDFRVHRTHKYVVGSTQRIADIDLDYDFEES